MSTQKKTFTGRISQFFFDPEFYKEIPKKTFSQALKHFLITMSFFGVALLAFTIISLWGINKMVHAGSKELAKLYPDELVLTLKDGQLTSSSPKPTYFSFESLGIKYKSLAFENFITIDTEGEALDQEKSNALILFTKDAFFVSKSQGRYETTSYSKEEDIVVTKPVAMERISAIIPPVRNVLMMGVAIFMVIFAIFYFNALLIYLGIFSFVFFCLRLIFGKKCGIQNTYTEIFEAAIFTLRPALLLTIPLFFIFKAIFLSSILFSLSFALLTLLFINLKATKKTL